MALRTEVVDLVGLYLLDDTYQVGGVGQVTIVQEEPAGTVMRALVEMIDPVSIERRCAALDTVNFVTFPQEKLGEVGTVLSGDSRNECAFHVVSDASE